jgi:hypothetical protein
MKRHILPMILVASSLVCGCTSVLLRYDTSVELKDNKEIYYTFEKPLDISGTAVACYLTAIAYGGWCWAYLGVPFEADRKAFIAEAHDRLEDQLQGRWYMIGDERLTNESYFNTRYTSNLYNQNGDILELKPVERPKHKQVSLKLENEINVVSERWNILTIRCLFMEMAVLTFHTTAPGSGLVTNGSHF